MHYSDVMLKLKSAPRPLTVRFNSVEAVERRFYAQKEREYQAQEPPPR